MLAQSRGQFRASVIPLPERAPTMRGLRQVALVRRQTTDQGAVQVIAPLFVHVQGPLQRRDSRGHLLLGHVTAKRHDVTLDRELSETEMLSITVSYTHLRAHETRHDLV